MKYSVLLAIMVYLPLQAVVFTVINTNDSGPGSLRQAILDANTAGGYATIDFNIPGPAPQIIVPTTFNSTVPPRAQVYQPLTNNNIVIDATTQPGYVFGSPSVIINCSVVAGLGFSGSCFFIQGANNCVIKGLGICNYVGSISGNGISIENTATNGASGNQITQCVIGEIAAAPPFGNTRGILISGRYTPTGSNTITNNIIGGPNTTDGNVLSGNAVTGLQLQLGPTLTSIENNFIGCDVTGTIVLGNGEGLNLLGSQPSVGQSGPCNNNIIQNNIISGNDDTAIVLQGVVQNNTIQNNKIGTNGTGTALLGATNSPGIVLNGITDPCNNNSIENNIIGGNLYGIGLFADSSFNQIVSNYIGTNTSGIDLGNINSGILIQGSNGAPCTNNLISLNTIEYNGNGVGATDFFGVLIFGDPTTPDILNAIVSNSIFNNASNGIVLLNNGNDNQEIPTINSAYFLGTQLTISATAPTTPSGAHFELQFFMNDINRNPITEGQMFIGSINDVAVGATVMQTFTVPDLTPMSYISATATNLNGVANAPGDTSPFTNNSVVMPMPFRLSAISAAIINKYCIFTGPSLHFTHINPYVVSILTLA